MDPADGQIVVAWTDAGAAKSMEHRTAHDIQTIEFISARGDAAPYTNRHDPAYLCTGIFNSDCAVVASSPGLANYLTSYASKSADDTPSKVGVNAVPAVALRSVTTLPSAL